ncbi:uncharacterized protein LOC126655541 [Mercurialis annua]|uniref:uncharacterized protein LOC126655541 n=1 Tax=Mercurialis annua TaxID=3986 RepID=UPI002160185B|nr:uncharacterized protein LOC126655541 [Mercurialis annua]
MSLCPDANPPATDESDRETKKVKNRTDTDIDLAQTASDIDGDMEVETISDDMVAVEHAPQHVSFKDKLLNSDRKDSSVREEEETCFIIADNDIERGIAGGIPTINFSDRIQNIIAQNMKLCVIVRLLGKTIGYRTLFGRLLKLWKPKSNPSLIDLDNNFFMVRFYSMEDYTTALSGGPWVLFGHYLTVQPWNPSFSPDNINVASVTAWVRFPGLPIQYYSNHVLKAIASTIGHVIRIDYNTEAMERGKFARLAINLDLSKPLISRILIDGRVQKIEYEGLPIICFDCGRYGHRENNCPFNNKTEGDTTQAKSPIPNTVQSPATTTAEAPFGPWMQVTNRRRKQNNNGTNQGNIPSGSRFTSIADLEEENQDSHFDNGKEKELTPTDILINGSPQIIIERKDNSKALHAKGKSKAQASKPNQVSTQPAPLMQNHAKHVATSSTSCPSAHNAPASLIKNVKELSPVSTSLDPKNHSAVATPAIQGLSVQLSQLKRMTLRDKFNPKGPDITRSQWSVKINKNSKGQVKVKKKKDLALTPDSFMTEMLVEAAKSTSDNNHFVEPAIPQPENLISGNTAVDSTR